MLEAMSVVFYQGKPILVWRFAGETKWSQLPL